MTKIFRASEQDWQTILDPARRIFSPSSHAATIRELRDRVAVLEVERVAPEASTEPTPPAAVPSDEELWGLRFHTLLNADSRLVADTWDAAHSLVFGHAHIKANRALYDYGYKRGLEAGRAERQAATEDSSVAQAGPVMATPEPEPVDFRPQTLHGIALDMVDSLGRSFNLLPEILDTLRRAIREPMAEPTPEPNQAPAGDRGLVEVVADFMGLHPVHEGKARAVILAIARWLRSVGNHGSAAELEREAQR
jgi:hypothetical protein